MGASESSGFSPREKEEGEVGNNKVDKGLKER